MFSSAQKVPELPVRIDGLHEPSIPVDSVRYTVGVSTDFDYQHLLSRILRLIRMVEIQEYAMIGYRLNHIVESNASRSQKKFVLLVVEGEFHDVILLHCAHLVYTSRFADQGRQTCALYGAPTLFS